MPGALPVRRMRRDAPRPSVLRENAVNSIVAMLATPSWVCGLPGSVPVVRDGQRRTPELGVPRKAHDYSGSYPGRLGAARGLRHQLTAVDFDDLPGDESGQRVGG